MRLHYISRYSIFPLLGEFYCLDFPDAEDEKEFWPASAFKLRKDEYPKGVSLEQNSYIFPWTPYTPTSSRRTRSENVRFYDRVHYDIYVDEISPRPENSEELRVQLTLRFDKPTERKIVTSSEFVRHPQWYKAGDIVEFATVGYKIINIVAPSDHEVRGLKGRLIGFVELDSTPFLLERPNLEEFEREPPPPLSPEKKANIRIWHDKEGNPYEFEMVFSSWDGQTVYLEWELDDYMVKKHLSDFCKEDQNLILELAAKQAVEDKASAQPAVQSQPKKRDGVLVPVLVTLAFLALIASGVFFAIRQQMRPQVNRIR